MNKPTIFDVGQLRLHPFLKALYYYDEVQSTNASACDLARRADVLCPALVLAEHQTAGRGRGTNRWWSAEGALTCSLIWPPPSEFVRSNWPKIALTTAVAICRTLEEQLSQIRFGIRWPNDVYTGEKKIAGILVEVPAQTPPARQCVVIGIGLNINNPVGAAPPELRSRATSLLDVAGRRLDVTAVLDSLLRHLEQDLKRLTDGAPTLIAEWQARCLLRGRHVILQQGAQTFAGTCQGIDEEGSLLIGSGSQSRRYFGGVLTVVE